MVVGILAEPQCAVCGEVTARVEVVPPGQLPARWRRWSRKHRQTFEKHRDPAQWYLMFAGVTGGDGEVGGVGDPVSADRAQAIIQAFRRPYRFQQVRTADLYDDAGFCEPCDAAYCHRHWHLSDTGYGRCPQQHGKSLDPHRSAG